MPKPLTARHVPLILILCLAVLGWLMSGGVTFAFDHGVSSALSLRSGTGVDTLISLLQAVSWIGGGVRRYLLALVFALWLGWRGYKARAGAMILATALANLASDALKDLYARARPDLVPHLDHASSAAFPSGHATSAALIALLFALLVPTQRRGAWVGGALAFMLLMGWSRVALGVHWPTDVMGGWLLGAALALMAWRLALRIEAR